MMYLKLYIVIFAIHTKLLPFMVHIFLTIVDDASRDFLGVPNERKGRSC